MARGLFITFEGTEGSGKTTQVEMLGEWLSSHDPVVIREPGGTELGERIREVVLFAGLVMDAEAEMYLFMAARRQLIGEVIAPALTAGQIVIADRYHDSTLAYQGGARGVPATWPSTFPRPDVTFLLEGPVAGHHPVGPPVADAIGFENARAQPVEELVHDRLQTAVPAWFYFDAKCFAVLLRHLGDGRAAWRERFKAEIVDSRMLERR